MKKILMISSLLFLIGVIAMAINSGKDKEAYQKSLQGLEKATFAGGCFWCMQPPYDKLKGVVSTRAGYTGGHKKKPTYEEVSSGTTGHAEAVEIMYDPARTGYNELLDIFWQSIDPTTLNKQFADNGTQYRTVIFYHNEEQKRLALASKESLERSGKFSKPVVTEIVQATEFYPAEEYHQKYYEKSPVRYNLYKAGSGRESFLKRIWGETAQSTSVKSGNEPGKETGEYVKPSRDELKKKLTPLQYKVTQEESTEKAFDNEYWDNHRDGIYVDIVSGEPLFSSTDKFESGTGWPSFSRPIGPDNIIERKDRSFFMERTEVKSKRGGSHLGHVFDDGPKPTGLRYCMNSAALRFIPKEDLEKEGYGEYKKLFERKQQ